MDGFDRERVGAAGHRHAPIVRQQFPQYGFVPAAEVGPYWALAHDYVLYDRMFQSNLDQSFAAHLYLIGAQAASAVNVPNGRPWGCDSPPSTSVATITRKRREGKRVFPCFTFPTLADELTTHGLTWRYYAPKIDTPQTWASYLTKKRHHLLRLGDFKPRFGQLWSAFDAIAQIRYGAGWAENVVSPETAVLNDISNGNLADVTWIVPDLRNSDHSSSRSASGPDWVATIINTIGGSRFWQSTAIFVLWDDSGGWYDHVAPPQIDYDGLGNRVPLIAVSAYAHKGYVSHEEAEFGSILKFTEQTFGLQTLAASDRRANDLSDAFDFRQPPRKYHVIPTKLRLRNFLTEPPSRVAPDDD